jgi:transaldolase
MNRLHALHDAGVSIWIDALSRELLDRGDFARLIADHAVTGATSNPTTFARAIIGSDRYDDQLRAALASGVRDPRELFFEVAVDDVRRAADLLRPVYDRSDGRDGFVSLDCTSRPRRRRAGHDRAGPRAVGPARAAQRDDQGPGYGGRPT